MNRSMITATNTLAQLQKQMDLISNNMANVDTTGFKRREATFTDLLFQEFRNQPNDRLEQNRMTPFNIRQGTGAKLGQTAIIMTQGALKTTERTLDTAFTAKGQYYKILVQTQNGSEERFTRDGAFYLSPISDNEVQLVTSAGNAVLDENSQPIYIQGEPKDYKVTEDGQFIIGKTDGTTQEFNLGIIMVNKPQFLEQKGGNLLGLPNGDLDVAEEDVFTELRGMNRNQVSIQQGVLEQSNVDLSKEMTDMINVQRGIQFHSRSISIADQMLGLVNGIR